MVRSAGSKGAADLVAIPHHPGKPPEGHVCGEECKVILIQVKSWKFSRIERRELMKLRRRVPPSCRVEAWVAEDRKTPYREFFL